MNHIYWIFPLVTLNNIPLIRSTSNSQPLIFNPYTLEIYEFFETSTTYQDGPYVAACPPQNYEEGNFNKKYSMDFKCLLLRHYSDRRDQSLDETKCDKSFELSVAYNNKQMQFGYDIFYEKDEYCKKKFNNDSHYEKFRRVSKGRWLRGRFDNFIFPVGTPFIWFNPYINLNKRVAIMNFIWIPKVTLQYNKSARSVKGVSYSIGKKAGQPALKCGNSNLDQELYEEWYSKNKQPSRYYSTENQKIIFSQVDLKFLPDDSSCKSEHQCVTKFNLVPAYEFKTTTSTSITCPNMTTIPVWGETTLKLLEYLDKFLVALAQVIRNKLTILSDVHDILTLQKLDKKKTLKQMYLYPNRKKIPIPRIILKMVKYKTHDCESPDLCWFQNIIVIHNEPKIIDKLCLEDKCEEWGWQRIQYANKNDIKNGQRSQHIYCCELNESLEKILGVTSDWLVHRHLDLGNFPEFNESTKELEYASKQGEICNKMNQLFKADESSEQNLIQDVAILVN